ncbi:MULTISPECIES: hypothetical protein [unclassified Sinorhizobium]|uniref:hypothetical protein n=1 Tax=unclassified Sinorhizobium TaxID=2613772 RepID=UPI0035256151
MSELSSVVVPQKTNRSPGGLHKRLQIQKQSVNITKLLMGQTSKIDESLDRLNACRAKLCSGFAAKTA